jgi:hypothetical protein
VTEHTAAALAALQAAHGAEPDFAGWLAGVLAHVAANLGSSAVLTQGCPGSWEASLVDQLVKGTVGHGDEDLAYWRQEPTGRLGEATGQAVAAPAAPTPSQSNHGDQGQQRFTGLSRQDPSDTP